MPAIALHSSFPVLIALDGPVHSAVQPQDRKAVGMVDPLTANRDRNGGFVCAGPGGGFE